MSEGGGIPAGWYQDPEDPGTWRYWDGNDWTQERSTPSEGADAPGSPPWLRVAIASLIALTTMLGAVAAWRASIASAESSDADRKGFADALAAEQARAGIDGSLDDTIFAYLRGRMYQLLAEGLDEQATASDPADEARLRAAADSYQQLSDLSMEFIAADALRPDGSLDLERAYDIEWALATSEQDLDPAPEFEAADEANTRSEQLIGLTGLLIAAAMFFTLAQVSRSKAYVLFLVGGGLVLIASTGLLVVVETQA